MPSSFLSVGLVLMLATISFEMHAERSVGVYEVAQGESIQGSFYRFVGFFNLGKYKLTHPLPSSKKIVLDSGDAPYRTRIMASLVNHILFQLDDAFVAENITTTLNELRANQHHYSHGLAIPSGIDPALDEFFLSLTGKIKTMESDIEEHWVLSSRAEPSVHAVREAIFRILEQSIVSPPMKMAIFSEIAYILMQQLTVWKLSHREFRSLTYRTKMAGILRDIYKTHFEEVSEAFKRWRSRHILMTVPDGA